MTQCEVYKKYSVLSTAMSVAFKIYPQPVGLRSKSIGYEYPGTFSISYRNL